MSLWVSAASMPNGRADLALQAQDGADDDMLMRPQNHGVGAHTRLANCGGLASCHPV